MSFNGSEGAFITLEEGAAMTANYRNTIQPGEVIGVFMGKEKIEKILEQPSCVGIRFYFAINEKGEKTLVLVGTDANKNDIVDGLIADNAIPCPSGCGESNLLNS
jgi:hypothetical protein